MGTAGRRPKRRRGSVLSAARRELWEETGLRPSPSKMAVPTWHRASPTRSMGDGEYRWSRLSRWKCWMFDRRV
ncbi:NUDIX domain-containing protein [Phycicoccus jejuensis]|uniref:NUDIX domain-containing protein n=1 Tax=Intrasporangiaceae TaxID=85021 RepID=UPI001CF57CCC